ncbi:Segregation and condensation protein A [Limihaloglobus sulfuriphilus]|uniref:Segregation and condensation protein A n=1 Tax=Limihaloglobus sulfuriphilus TaxID=1851148 RepID=A0A1Q2MD60_9BACT|nr:segregation/condensation protein A [Limihaloglobus sulfuriphilus]AQQ70636.1 Segregation and condensation protein A [Limihaloglobus sulfuriphilus]
MSDYKIQLDNLFAGPLDLLLYLVRKEEVDVYDIPISKITQEYLKYMEMLSGLDIELAGEFLTMAATLMEIKSAMLLPRTSLMGDEDGEGDDIDPRSELIKQLLEYKKFRDAANLLDSRQADQQEKYPRPDSILSNIKNDQEPELDMDDVSIWLLLETFDNLMRSIGRYQDYSEIQDDTPIDYYQVDILHRLQKLGPMTFEHIFQDHSSRSAMIGLFLALLELVRDRLVWTEQSDDSKVIYLKALTDKPAYDAVHSVMLAVEEENNNEQSFNDNQ